MRAAPGFSGQVLARSTGLVVEGRGEDEYVELGEVRIPLDDLRIVNGYCRSCCLLPREVEVTAGAVDRQRYKQNPAWSYRCTTEMFTILDHEYRNRHPWALALYGKCRGEIAGLRRSNVNVSQGNRVLPAQSVRIEENRVAAGRHIEAGSPKSKASNRTLPMPGDVVDSMKAARNRQTEERLRFREGYGAGEYVASEEAGLPYHPNLLTFRWARLLDALGIEQVRLHDARHSRATLMHLRGVPIAVIAAWLGHANAAFTMSVYAHSQDDASKATASSFERVATTRDTQPTPGG